MKEVTEAKVLEFLNSIPLNNFVLFTYNSEFLASRKGKGTLPYTSWVRVTKQSLFSAKLELFFISP